MIPVNAFFHGLLVAIGLACVALWMLICNRLSHGQPIIPFTARQPVRWRGRDVVLAFVAAFVLLNLCSVPFMLRGAPEAKETEQTATTSDAETRPPEAEDTSGDSGNARLRGVSTFELIIISESGKILACVSVVVWLLKRGSTLTDLGCDLSQPGRDFQLGIAGFLVASMPVLLIQRVLIEFIPPEHEVQNILLARPGWVVALITVLVAVVGAPLTEEFFFRVLLQGWLEARFEARAQKQLSGAPTATDENPASATGVAIAGEIDSPLLASHEFVAAHEPPADDAQHGAAAAPLNRPRSIMPNVIGSLVFALVHIGNGPSPVPLFFYSLMLGYLYQQTHRLLPSVVAHASLNLLSTSLLLSAAG